MLDMKKSTRLLKIFISYILVIFIPLTAVCWINYYTNVSKLKSEFEENALMDIDNFSTTVETLLADIQNVSMQLSLTPSINKILKDPFRVSKYDYVTLRGELQNFCLPSNLFHSIYIYLKLNNKVLTSGEGIYELDNFYDKDLIMDAVSSNKHYVWYASRRLIPGGVDNKPEYVVSFAKDIPITETLPLGNLVINIRTNDLLKVIKRIDYRLLSKFLILDSNSHIVVSNDIEGLKKEELKRLVNSMNDKRGLTALKVEQQNYLVTYLREDYTDWIYISLIANDSLMSQIYNERDEMLRKFIISLFFGVILSYIISRKMYDPWKRLLSKIGEHLQNYGNDTDVRDEYNAVDDALDHLIHDNHAIQEIIRENKPILKDKLVSDLLWNNIDDMDYINIKIEEVGIQFKFDKYIPLVVMINSLHETDPNDQSSDNIRVYIRKIIEEEFSKTAIITSTLLDKDKIGFIINFCETPDESDIRKPIAIKSKNIISFIKKQMPVFICFSFGNACTCINDIGYSFLRARRKLDYKPVIDDGDILFEDQKDEEFQYPLLLQKKIINGIMSCNRNAVDDGMNELFDKYISRSNYSRDEVQQMVILIIGNVMNELWKDEETKRVFEINIFREIQECQNSRMLKKAIQFYFYELMKSQPVQENTNEQSYITSAIVFMQANYNHNISVVNIAESVGLNPSYLNRIFKRNTRKTLSEYLTLIRIEKAKEMLNQDKLSINDVSSAVGYNSSHSLIRAFKKYEGITPGEYRQTYQTI